MMTSRKLRRRVQQVVVFILLGLVLLVVLFPIYWMLLTAVKPASELYLPEPKLWTSQPSLNSLGSLFYRTPVPQQMRNSMSIASAVTLVSLMASAMGSYSLSRLRYPGRDFFAAAIFFTYLIPGSLLLIPLYTLFSGLGLLNSLHGIGLAYLSFSIPFCTWMLKGYFQSIPMDLEEAALVDGCTRLRALAFVILPLAAPGLVASAIFAFTLSWNEYLVAFVFNNKSTLMTLPVGLSSLIFGDVFLWGEIMSGATLMSIPVLILYFMAQRFIVTGLTAGAVKA